MKARLIMLAGTVSELELFLHNKLIKTELEVDTAIFIDIRDYCSYSCSSIQIKVSSTIDIVTNVSLVGCAKQSKTTKFKKKGELFFFFFYSYHFLHDDRGNKNGLGLKK